MRPAGEEYSRCLPPAREKKIASIKSISIYLVERTSHRNVVCVLCVISLAFFYILLFG